MDNDNNIHRKFGIIILDTIINLNGIIEFFF